MVNLKLCSSMLSVLHSTRLIRCTLSSFVLSTSDKKDRPSDLDDILPPEGFINSFVRRPSHREKLTSVVAELQLFREIFGDSALPKLDKDVWSTLMVLFTPEERSNYLLELWRSRRLDVVEDGALKISELNQRLYEKGGMVYAPYFHTLFDLRGQEFRRQINNMFGSRVLSQRATGEELPRLVIDCRFMRDYTVAVQSKFIKQIQEVSDDNWTSRRPFIITIANFVPDKVLSDIAKRFWKFLYGPSGSADYVPHVFAANSTSSGILKTTQSNPDDVVYISPRATNFLPSHPPACKSVVLCASSDYQPWSSSVSAATKDGIKAYRIPMERHVLFDGNKRRLTLPQSASVLRSYFSGDDLGDAIKNVFVVSERRSRDHCESKTQIQKYKRGIQQLSPDASFNSRTDSVKRWNKQASQVGRENRQDSREKQRRGS